ncbi:MAG: anti-sigma regulatory factor, partial [Micromonosporaceae bacterium]
GDGDLECEFSVTEASLSVAVSVPAEGAPRLPSVHTFAWKVLSTLAGEVRAEHSNGRATIWLNKRRANQP